MRKLARATVAAALVAVVAAWTDGVAAEPSPVSVPRPDPAAIRAALDRTYAWLGAHPPEERITPYGFICLDAWTWTMFATWHPDERRRAEAGEQADRRLRGIPPPSDWTPVSLSYWALVLALMDLRGLPLDEARAAMKDVDVDPVLVRADPTTRFWTATLLRQAKIEVTVDRRGTFLGSRANATPGVPTTADAYAVFHEIVPPSALGHRPLTGVSDPELAVAIALLPGIFDFSRTASNTDAAAEAVASLGLLGRHDTPTYREGIAWLLGQQNEDGTYRSARDARREATVDGYRHVVLVASFALLTAVERFEPVVPRR
jgi:hypothetical protein